jgi:hypothetical protein
MRASLFFFIFLISSAGAAPVQPAAKKNPTEPPASSSAKKPAQIAAAPTPAPAVTPLYPTRSTEPIVFIWPPEGMSLAASGEFILGSISPATAPLTINGTPVAAHKKGGFLAWLW